MNDADRRLIDSLLDAYRGGCFPMASPGPRGRSRIEWYSPDPRAIIPLEPGLFRVPRSLRQRVRSGRFRITTDTAFDRVIRACAATDPARPDRAQTWIDDRIIHAYTLLHRAGHAHSLEAWLGRDLVGGLYGVHIGGLFAGESMFSRPAAGGADSSKVCLVHLVAHLRARGFLLLDTQFRNPHIDQFGCQEIPRREYLRRLRIAVDRPADWQPFDPAAARQASHEPPSGPPRVNLGKVSGDDTE